MNAVAALDDYLDGLLGVGGQAPVSSAPASAPTASPPPAAAPGTSAPQQATAATPPAPAAAPQAVASPRAYAPAPAPPSASVPPPAARPLPGPAMDEDHAAPGSHRRAADRSSRWLRLRCTTQAYGLELLKVQEVVLPTPLLPLRGTRPEMLGVMNLRGQVVPVMDLGVHLGQAAQPDSASTRIVVLEENGETMGLRVTAVEDVVNLVEAQIEAPTASRASRLHCPLFRGIARQSAEPMILLDASCLLSPDNAS